MLYCFSYRCYSDRDWDLCDGDARYTVLVSQVRSWVSRASIYHSQTLLVCTSTARLMMTIMLLSCCSSLMSGSVFEFLNSCHMFTYTPLHIFRSIWPERIGIDRNVSWENTATPNRGRLCRSLNRVFGRALVGSLVRSLVRSLHWVFGSALGRVLFGLCQFTVTLLQTVWPVARSVIASCLCTLFTWRCKLYKIYEIRFVR